MIRRLRPLFAVVLLVAITTADNFAKNETLKDQLEVKQQTSNEKTANYPSDRFDGRSARPSRSDELMLEVSKNGGIENSFSGIGKVLEPRSASGSTPKEEPGVEPREEDLIEAADFGIKAMNDLYYVKEPKLYEMGLYLSADNPARFVAAFNDQSEEAKQLAKYGYATLEAATKFRSKFPDVLRQATTTRRTDKSPLRQQCPKKGIPQCPPASLRYRTTDGSCNNLKELWWGSAMSPMQRFLPAVYEDNIQSVRRSVSGSELPSAREISGYVHEERDSPLVSVTHMLMQWGQFVDHDITATAQSKAFNSSVPQCCLNGGEGFQPPELMHPECLPIAVPARDSRLNRMGVRCMEFVRSGPVPREDCEFGSREQLSQVTSFVDASTVYSSSARQGDGLRIFRNGLMQYGKLQSRRPLLPREEDSDLCRRGSLSTSCFKAGDIRLSEQPALISLHVVFLRLHNRLATQMAALNPHWGDEKIFQETRKIVGAIVQHVTYREFLPIVLGHDVMKIFDIELLRKGYYEGYDEAANPNIANEFSSAAFRFGHSLVQSSFMRFDNNHRPIFNNVSIHEEFMNPVNLESAGSVDRILLGLVNQPAQKRDEFISEELTNHLFQTPGFPFGMDLASLNIQRGRDHGIPPFVDWRLPCALSPVRDWSDLERIMNPDTARKFRDLYAAVEDVDLFTAGLAEKPVSGGLVGPTFACIIAQQFRNLRKGDRFWYENPFLENGFTPTQLQQIRRVTLAQILCRTLDSIDDVQPFVMLAPDKLRNQRLPCSDPILEQMDLGPWMERPRRRSLDPEVIVEGDIEVETQTEPETEPRAATRKKGAGQRSPQRPKPTKTKINQHNRITVKRPLGPHENLTIVVNNNAVNAPVFVSDSIYNSNVQLNQFPGSQAPNQKPTSEPQDSAQNPYYPHNFQDPNNPNPPSYGFSPRPMNNYVPNNEFFAYSVPNMPSYRPPSDQNNFGQNQQYSPNWSTSRPPGDQNNSNQNQQYSYFTTRRPTTQRPYESDYVSENNQGTYFPTKSPKPSARPTTTTRRPYPDYDQENTFTPQLEGSDNQNSNRPPNNSYSSQTDNQNPYANFQPNNSDRDQQNPSYNPRPTKKPKQPYQGMSNRRYPEARPQSISNVDGSKSRPPSRKPSQGSTQQYLANASGSVGAHYQTKPTTSSRPYNQNTDRRPSTGVPQSPYSSASGPSIFPSGRPTQKPNTQANSYNFYSSAEEGVRPNDGAIKGNGGKHGPHYLHTHTTISDVKFVTPEKPQRHEVIIDTELPRPLSLQNRESQGGEIETARKPIVVNLKTNLNSTINESGLKDEGMIDSAIWIIKEEPKLATTTTISSDEMEEVFIPTTLNSVFEENSNRIVNNAPISPLIQPIETLVENDTLSTNISNELPRPILLRHGN